MAGSSSWSRQPPPLREANPIRPATNQGRPFTRMAPTQDHLRPTTAPSPLIREMSLGSPRRHELSSHDHETSPKGSSIALPPISSITLRDRDGPQPRMMLPSIHDRPPTRDAHSSPSAHVLTHSYDHYAFGRPMSSSSAQPWYASTTPSEARYKDSISTVASEVLTPMRESGPPFDRPLTSSGAGAGAGADRPSTGYGFDRPTSSSYDRPFGGYDKHPPAYMWERPPTAGSGSHAQSHVAFEPTDRDIHPNPRHMQYSPRASADPRLSNASHQSHSVAQANYSRVLVGSLCATCQRLQDENGDIGLFFFAHDLGVRTEGTFTLKFTLTDLTS